MLYLVLIVFILNIWVITWTTPLGKLNVDSYGDTSGDATMCPNKAGFMID
jgi:hypothetical protein